MQLYNGLEVLEISAPMMGRIETVYPTLLWDDENVVLVDTGYPGQLPLIQQAFEKANVMFHRLNKIILTHQDLDHIGSAPSILDERAQAVEDERAQAVEVLANSTEKPFIEGNQRLLKLTPDAIRRAVESLPAEVPQQWRDAFQMTLENPPKTKVHKTVEHEELLPYCSGIVVINTPGHTPGHISLYHQPSKTLIAADALTVVDGQLQGPDEEQTLDLNLAKQSLRNLSLYDIEKVVCYHGGVYQDNPNQRILELIAN